LGGRYRKSVRIALEAGPIAEETRQEFHLNNPGELWFSHIGDIALLLRITEPRVNDCGVAFSLHQETTVSIDAISFYGQPEVMAKLMLQLERALNAWPIFEGIALHEILAP
jgi:hypothetical protein